MALIIVMLLCGRGTYVLAPMGPELVLSQSRGTYPKGTKRTVPPTPRTCADMAILVMSYPLCSISRESTLSYHTYTIRFVRKHIYTKLYLYELTRKPHLR